MTKKEYMILSSIFFLIIIIKVYLSLQFPTPFVFNDEYSYSSYTKDILSNPYYIITPKLDQVYPPGYPLLLIPSFILYPNMESVYRSILVTNAILSTLIIIISYIILKSFIPKNFAIFGSILIALLPTNTLYNFMILSENIYIPLYLLSGYLILKSIGTNNKFLHIVTGIVLFYLTITRAFGILAYISFFSVILYQLYIDKNRKYDFLKKNCFLIITPIILLCIWIVLKRIYGSGLYWYNSGQYIQNVLYIFNKDNFILFSKLVINEIDYLILTSYFTFFIFSILILLRWKKLDKSIKIYILYSIIYGILSIVLTVLHMIEFAKNPDSTLYLRYFIFGRYIDPILPTVFIIGFISWDIICRNKNIDINNISKKFIYITVFTIIFFLVTYPYYAIQNVVNVLPIHYIDGQYNILYILPLVLLILTLILFRRPRILIIILIIFSLMISIPPYEYLKLYSNQIESYYINDMKNILSYNAMRNEYILIDQESFNDPWATDHFLIKFWAMPNIIYRSNVANFSLTSDIRYIVSKKPLKYDIAKISPGKIILYEPNNTRNVQMIPTTGFHDIKYNTNYVNYTWMAWMENNATLYIYIPYEDLKNRYSLMTEMMSFYKSRNLQIYINNKLSYEKQILTNLTEASIKMELEYGENIIRFYTKDGCQRPIDFTDSTEDRCVSIYFQRISLI